MTTEAAAATQTPGAQPNNAQPSPEDQQKPTDQNTKPEDQPKPDETKPDEAKPDETKPDEKKPEGAPEKYEFKAPEGKAFDPGFLETYSQAAKELDLSQEKAQAMIDKMAPVLEQRQIAQVEKMRTDWAEESRTDSEFGGDKLADSMGVAKAALTEFGNDKLKDLLNVTGIGNHPEIIRFFYKVGKAVSGDNFVGGHKEGKGGSSNFNDLANKLYGSGS